MNRIETKGEGSSIGKDHIEMNGGVQAISENQNSRQNNIEQTGPELLNDDQDCMGDQREELKVGGPTFDENIDNNHYTENSDAKENYEDSNNSLELFSEEPYTSYQKEISQVIGDDEIELSPISCKEEVEVSCKDSFISDVDSKRSPISLLLSNKNNTRNNQSLNFVTAKADDNSYFQVTNENDASGLAPGVPDIINQSLARNFSSNLSPKGTKRNQNSEMFSSTDSTNRVNNSLVGVRIMADTETYGLNKEENFHNNRAQESASLNYSDDDEEKHDYRKSIRRSQSQNITDHNNNTSRHSLSKNNHTISTNEYDNQTYKDLSSAKKKLDATSVALIERLRGAAQKRKLELARSRDSLAAKEKLQLQSIAEASKRRPSSPVMQDNHVQSCSTTVMPSIHSTFNQNNSVYEPFKARPLPATNGLKGSGGQIGVPRVEKRPTTTPVSPPLGPQRQQIERIMALELPPTMKKTSSTSIGILNNDNKTLKGILKGRLDPGKPNNYYHQKQSQSNLPFKARLLPSTTGSKGHGGQAGVPKIQKRPVTVPSSPCLGVKRKTKKDSLNSRRKTISNSHHHERKEQAVVMNPPKRLLSGKEASEAKDRALRERREQEEIEARRRREFRARSLPQISGASSSSSVNTSGSPGLLGLQLLNNPSGEGLTPNDVENTPPSNRIRNSRRSLPFYPSSTKRAEKRAQFDAMIVQREVEKKEQKRKQRQSLIDQKNLELDELRDRLR